MSLSLFLQFSQFPQIFQIGDHWNVWMLLRHAKGFCMERGLADRHLDEFGFDILYGALFLLLLIHDLFENILPFLTLVFGALLNGGFDFSNLLCCESDVRWLN